MTHLYLNQYLPILAFIVLVFASIKVFRNGHTLPSILIGAPAAATVLLKIITEFTAPQNIGYVYSPEGEALGAHVAVNVWQQGLFWVYPIAILSIAVGVLMLVRQLPRR